MIWLCIHSLQVWHTSQFSMNQSRGKDQGLSITRSCSLCWSKVGTQEEHKYTYLRTWIQVYWSTCTAQPCRSHYCFFSVRQPWKGNATLHYLGTQKQGKLNTEFRLCIISAVPGVQANECTVVVCSFAGGYPHTFSRVLLPFLSRDLQMQNGSLPVRNRCKRCVCARVWLIQHHDTQPQVYHCALVGLMCRLTNQSQVKRGACAKCGYCESPCNTEYELTMDPTLYLSVRQWQATAKEHLYS